MIGTIRSLFARLLRRLVPSRYSGRLDRLGPDEQQAVIGYTFRSGM